MPFGKKKSQQITPEFEAGPSMSETRTRSRKLVIAGLLLAVCAGIGSYVLLSRAQQSAGTTTIPRTSLVVAKHTIAARTPITADDLAVREVPLDGTNAQGTFTAADQVVGRTAGVTILQGQLVTSNLFTFSVGTASVAILEPGESLTADSPDWRAVSISVPDDRAVGGVLSAGEHVDIFVTTTINVNESVSSASQLYGDKSTKVAYQDVLIRTGGRRDRAPPGVRQLVLQLRVAARRGQPRRGRLQAGCHHQHHHPALFTARAAGLPAARPGGEHRSGSGPADPQPHAGAGRGLIPRPQPVVGSREPGSAPPLASTVGSRDLGPPGAWSEEGSGEGRLDMALCLNG